MPYQKLKSESYRALRGINAKTSTYIMPETEFLNLQNVCFQTTGALQSVPGEVKFNSQGNTNPVTGLADFSFNDPIYIATTKAGAFDVSGGTYALIVPSIMSGATSFYTVSGASVASQFVGSTGPFDFYRGNYLFAANGEDFYTIMNRPPPGVTTMNFGLTNSVQYSLPIPDNSDFSIVGPGTSFSYFVDVYSAFVRFDGLVGPALDQKVVLLDEFGATQVDRFIYSAQFNTVYGQSLTLASYGVSYKYQWWSNDSGNNYYVYGQSGIPYPIPVTTNVEVSTFASYSLIAGSSYAPFLGQGTFFPMGNSPPSTTTIELGHGYSPTTIEVINNRMFFAGFLQSREHTISSPDVVWYSLPGQYELRNDQNFFYVRKGDGDTMTCLKSYLGNLVMFKTNAISLLSGTERVDTFQVTDITDQYGCLSANGACVWKQYLWFLDKKGIAAYNGANTEIISNAMEPFFQRMNVEAARFWGRIDHVKERNEVWCTIPIDGSTYANLVIFYDYSTQAWGTRTVSEATALMNTTNTYERTKTFIADADANIFRYDIGVFTNDLHPYTSIIKSRYISTEYGHSTEKMFRRLFVDADIPPGMTFPIDVNIYANSGATLAYSTTMALTPFAKQNRIDFGIPAADISVEMIYAGGSFLKVNGFTVEYRFQRNVTVTSNS